MRSNLSNGNAFALRLIRLLVEPQTGNVFVSPCGLFLALTMAYNGARGETRQGMARALGLEDVSLEEVNRESERLIRALSVHTATTRVCIANSLCVQHLDRIVPEFLQCCRRSYKADIGDLQAGPEAINAWVREQTQGAIDNIVEDIPSDLLALLASVVYFQSRWQMPFLMEDTRVWLFTLADGSRTRCRMMFQTKHMLYLSTSTFQAARLPYQDGFSMTVFLPNEGVSLREMTALLTPENWEDWHGKFRTEYGQVGLPRFRFNYLTEMSDVLAKMGMGLAFDRDHGNLSGVSPDFYISKVRHKACVDVSEQGTTAAAVTAVEMLFGSVDPLPLPRFVLILDRPFLCAIEDERTGILLFMGAVMMR